MSIFNIDDDLKKFLVRAQLTLDKIDAALLEARTLLQNADAAITDVRQIVEAVRGKSIHE